MRPSDWFILIVFVGRGNAYRQNVMRQPISLQLLMYSLLRLILPCGKRFQCAELKTVLNIRLSVFRAIYQHLKTLLEMIFRIAYCDML